MRSNHKRSLDPGLTLAKCPTGIPGLDDITNGGLPRGRSTLICGGAGSGKTVLSTQFLVHGALHCNEPGVFMGFEETPEELVKNVASMGFELKRLAAKRKLALEYIYIERAEIEETGEYDLEGLFIRLNRAIESIHAKRVVLDTIEALFAGFSDVGILRAEFRRLFRWLRQKGVTAIVTGEQGDRGFTRHGLEEYISDCVILLDHRVLDQVPTRRLRIIKYRGTSHGTNEYPFLIDEHGVTVAPITSLRLEGDVTTERVSTGIAQLDAMLGGKGYYRGSTILVTGGSGSGKTSLACHFVDAACGRGERSLYLGTEESGGQIMRNMRSIGIDLGRWVKKGFLRFHCIRPTAMSLELYLSTVYRELVEFKPDVVVLDPVTGFEAAGSPADARTMLTRLIDFIKMSGSTGLLTGLTEGGSAADTTEVGISSIIDTWVLLRNLEASGERNRGLYVLKSRGMAHSNQIREFRLTNHGVELADVYLGPGGVLTGAARASREAEERAVMLARRNEIERQQRALEYKRKTLKARIATLQSESEAEAQELRSTISQQGVSQRILDRDQVDMAKRRGADSRKGGLIVARHEIKSARKPTQPR